MKKCKNGVSTAFDLAIWLIVYSFLREGIVLKKKKEKLLYSFDIFDTLVTRKCARPLGIFAIVQEKIANDEGLPLVLREDFYNIRIDAEKTVRESAFNTIGAREILFDDIYEYIKNYYELTQEKADYLKNLELETEKENILPIEANIQKVKELVNRGENVVLISDMYFTSDILREILVNIDTVFEKIKIYVSSEYKTAKWIGGLYKEIQKEEGVKYKNWTHFGDNIIADVKRAKKLGIKAKRYDFPSLMPYEKMLLETYSHTAEQELLIGASRYIRLTSKEEKNRDKYEFGASFAAPVVYCYVNYVINEALKQGFKTLHFVARDGYIPKFVADIIIKKRNLDIKTKYVYGSRYAWRVPSEQNLNDIVDTMLNEYYERLSVSFIAYRLHVKTEDLNGILNYKDTNSILTNEERFELRNQFYNDENLRSFVIDSNAQRRQLIKEYIRQEFDLTDSKIAFVELNGSGFSQDILSGFINELKPCRMHTFYFAGTFDPQDDKISKKYLFSTEKKPHYYYMELLFRAPHGQTLGYKNEGNKITPILEDETAAKLKDWGWEEYLKGIEDYTNLITTTNAEIFSPERGYYTQDYILKECDYKTAEILGNIPYSVIGKEEKIAASKITLRDILWCVFTKQEFTAISYFPSIAFARSNPFSKIIKGLILKLFSMTILQEIRLLLELKKHKDKSIMFWGASLFLENFINKYNIKSNNILGVIDRNKNRQNEKIGKYKIYSPNILDELKPNMIFMTIKNRNKTLHFDIEKFININYPKIEFAPNFFD